MNGGAVMEDRSPEKLAILYIRGLSGSPHSKPHRQYIRFQERGPAAPLRCWYSLGSSHAFRKQGVEGEEGGDIGQYE